MGELRLPVLAAEGFYLGRPYGDASACFQYGGKRICPVHYGEDYVRGVRGGSAIAMHDFRVVYAGGVGDRTPEWPGGMGGYGAILDLGGGFRQQTAHMVEGSCPFPVGYGGTAGTRVGEVGQTGTASGDHLHNDLIRSGLYVDPQPYLQAGSIPSDLAAAAPAAPPISREARLADEAIRLRNLKPNAARHWAEWTELTQAVDGQPLLRVRRIAGEVMFLREVEGDHPT